MLESCRIALTCCRHFQLSLSSPYWCHCHHHTGLHELIAPPLMLLLCRCRHPLWYAINQHMPTVSQQADGEPPDDDVDCLLTQDPLAVSTNPEHPVCPNLPPWKGTEQCQSPGTAVYWTSVKPRWPGCFQFKDFGDLANRDFFIDPAFHQSTQMTS